MTTAKKLMTAEEFMALPDDGRRRELLDGVVVELAPASDVYEMMDAALKTTDVRPGLLRVEREYGTLERVGVRAPSGVGGLHARQDAETLGDDAEQPWHRARHTGRARGEYGVLGGSGLRVSSSVGGPYA